MARVAVHATITLLSVALTCVTACRKAPTSEGTAKDTRQEPVAGGGGAQKLDESSKAQLTAWDVQEKEKLALDALLRFSRDALSSGEPKGEGGTRSGYRFVLTKGAGSYAYSATPEDGLQKSGARSFCVDFSGVLVYRRDGAEIKPNKDLFCGCDKGACAPL